MIEQPELDLEGTDPYAIDPPRVTLAGTDAQLRRLGTRDIIALTKICHKVASRGSQETLIWLRKLPEELPWKERLIAMLIFGFPHAEHEITEWLASLLVGWTPADVLDPNKFPLGSEIKVFRAVAGHPDLGSFFAEGRTAIVDPKSLAAIERLLPQT